MDSIDLFISSLGQDGQDFISALEETKSRVAFCDPHDGDTLSPLAYYSTPENTSFFRANLGFGLLFTHRIHEGTHAIQSQLTDIDYDSLSIADRLRIFKAREIQAKSVEAYFNALAMQTQPELYMNLWDNDGAITATVVSVAEQVRDGLSPQDIQTHHALEWSTAKIGTPLSRNRLVHGTRENIYEYFCLLSETPETQACNPKPLTRAQLGAMFDRVAPLPESVREDVLDYVESPVDLSLHNHLHYRRTFGHWFNDRRHA